MVKWSRKWAACIFWNVWYIWNLFAKIHCYEKLKDLFHVSKKYLWSGFILWSLLIRKGFFSDHLHAKVAVKYLLRFDTTPPHFMLITKSSASVPQEFCVCVDKPIKSHSQLKLGWVVLRLSWFLSQAILRISNIRSYIYMVCMF